LLLQAVLPADAKLHLSQEAAMVHDLRRHLPRSHRLETMVEWQVCLVAA
jgi:hypothetical protein